MDEQLEVPDSPANIPVSEPSPPSALPPSPSEPIAAPTPDPITEPALAPEAPAPEPPQPSPVIPQPVPEAPPEPSPSTPASPEPSQSTIYQPPTTTTEPPVAPAPEPIVVPEPVIVPEPVPEPISVPTPAPEPVKDTPAPEPSPSTIYQPPSTEVDSPQISDIKPQVSEPLLPQLSANDIVNSLTDEQLKMAASLYAKKNQSVLSRKGVEARQAVAQKNISDILAFIKTHSPASNRTIARALNLPPRRVQHYMQLLTHRGSVTATGWGLSREYRIKN